MKIDNVILCVNDTHTYYSFWPMIYKAWLDKTGIEPHLFYVGEKNDWRHNWLKGKTGQNTVSHLSGFGKHPAEPWITTWALFYGQTMLDPEKTYMTCGIDQMPLSNRVQEVYVKDIDPESYVPLLSNPHWRDKEGSSGRNFASSFHIAKGRVMQEAMQFEDSWEEEIKKIDSKDLYREWAFDCHLLGYKWGYDETWSTIKLQEYEERGGKVVTPVTKSEFWDRQINEDNCITGNYRNDLVSQGYFTECACPKDFYGQYGPIMTLLNLAPNSHVHETAIVDPGAKVGRDTKVWHFSHICDNAVVGENCTIGQNVYIGPNVTIGDNCKIGNGANIFEGVTIGDNVFIGPSVCFTNDLYPKAVGDWELSKTVVDDNVSIGANSTILCNITLGEGCMIGAGSTVTRSIEPHKKVIGNKAISI